MKKTDFIPLKESGNLTSALEGIIQSLRLIEGFTKNLLPESLITEGLRSALKELRQEINFSGKTWMNYSTSSGFFDTLTLLSDIYIQADFRTIRDRDKPFVIPKRIFQP